MPQVPITIAALSLLATLATVFGAFDLSLSFGLADCLSLSFQSYLSLDKFERDACEVYLETR